MKALLGISVAALMAASPAVAQEPNWTGAYIGAHAGYAWGDVDQTQTNGGMPYGPYSYSPEGAFGGATAGYNWQAKSVVLGIEGDLGYLDLSGSGIIPSSVPGKHQNISLDGGLYGDVTARAGILVTPNTLLYGKGGFAFYDGEASQATTNPGYVTHGTDTFTGWVAGGGIERQVGEHLTLRVEFLHFDFGSQSGDQTSISDPPVGFVYKNKSDVTTDSVKVGVAYHF